MPIAVVRSTALEIAARCPVVRGPFAACNHMIAARALVIVSIVVKDFEAIMTKVVVGSSAPRTSRTCAPSMFDTK